MSQMKTNDIKKNSEQKKPNLRYQRDKDREKVKGLFQFHECPGGQLSFVYRKYKEDPIEAYTLQDGKQYELPLGVARHLNKNCNYPIHHYEVDSAGVPRAEIGQKKQRVSFRSLEFMGPDDLEEPIDIVTVRTIHT